MQKSVGFALVQHQPHLLITSFSLRILLHLPGKKEGNQIVHSPRPSVDMLNRNLDTGNAEGEEGRIGRSAVGRRF
jgi:hypothetical protein